MYISVWGNPFNWMKEFTFLKRVRRVRREVGDKEKTKCNKN